MENINVTNKNRYEKGEDSIELAILREIEFLGEVPEGRNKKVIIEIIKDKKDDCHFKQGFTISVKTE